MLNGINPTIYSYILMTASSVVSSLLQDIARDSHKKQIKRKHNRDTKKEDVGTAVLIGIATFIILYVLICTLTVLVYAFIQGQRIGGSTMAVFESMWGYYIWSNLWGFIIIPGVVSFIKWLMKISLGSKVYAIKILVAVVSSVVLIASPFLTRAETISSFPMEEEILTELRTMDFPYEDRIFSIEHFSSMMSEGYWTADNPKPDTSNSNENNNSREETAPTKNIADMTFGELVDAADYYTSVGSYFNAVECLERAYEIYEARGGDALGDWNSVGRMFYYMSQNDMGNYYEQGADAFLQDNEYRNALYCYRELIEVISGKEAKSEVARKMLSLWTNIANSDENNAYVVGLIENAYVQTFDEGYSPLSEELSAICENGIDSPLLQILNITNHVSEGNYEDGERIVDLLQTDKYADCPKLQILSNVYRFHSGQEFSCETLYELYRSYPDFFEEEDRINLVWLLYESGEYIKTYEVSANMKEKIDESEDTSEDTEDNSETLEETISGDVLEKCQMLLIRTESYLQDSEAFSGVDEVELYKDITETLSALGVDDTGEEETESDNDEEKTDNNTAKQINNPIAARLRLSQCILAGRIGIDISYAGLSDICEELFKTDSKTGLYIVAALSYQDGVNNKTVELCNQILNMSDTQDDFQSRVLLLKADALISLASDANASEEQKSAYYDEAEKVLLAVRDMARNDYVASSQRLANLYEVLGIYDEAHEIQENLMKLQQME